VDEARELTVDYYDLVTDFYEYGWSQSFHFAQRAHCEGFQESLKRQEYWLSWKAGIEKGSHWLDLGCGVSGPMRNIARFTEAKITGVNLCRYQISRAKKYIQAEGMQKYLDVDYCDFTKLEKTYSKEQFDGAYAFEAVCHAPNLLDTYKSIFEVLRPGGVFACYEWCLTDKYDAKCDHHKKVKRDIEAGTGVANLVPTSQILDSLKGAGFDIEFSEDRTLRTELWSRRWFEALRPCLYSLSSWKRGPNFVHVVTALLKLLEYLKIVPTGSAKSMDMLVLGQGGLVEGGKLGIFSPHFFVKARKPLN